MSNNLTRQGLAIVEAKKPGGEPCFMQVPGTSEEDIKTRLRSQNIAGRLIAMNADLQFRTQQPIVMTEKMLDESQLNQLGFKLINSPKYPGLDVVPSHRPEPQINLEEAARLLSLAERPAYYYNHMVAGPGQSVVTINESKLKALFAHVGYEISDDISVAIRNKKVPGSDIPQQHLSPSQHAFMMQFAQIPGNLSNKLVENARQIQLFDDHKNVNLKPTSTDTATDTPANKSSQYRPKI